MRPQLYQLVPKTWFTSAYLASNTYEHAHTQVCDLLSNEGQALQMRTRTTPETLSQLESETCGLDPKQSFVECDSVDAFKALLANVVSRRAQGSTNMNATSSRSHLVLTMAIKRTAGKQPHSTHSFQQKSKRDNCESLRVEREYMSKLILVDLAGNEREDAREGKVAAASLREEGKAVNTSLLALSECLRERARSSVRQEKQRERNASLLERGRGAFDHDTQQRTAPGACADREASGSKNGDAKAGAGNMMSQGTRARRGAKSGAGLFRSSALTRLLKEYLMGAKIFFLACCSPAASSVATTAQTLWYASRVKEIKTNANDSALLHEQDLERFPLEVLPCEQLVKNGQIPRSHERMTVYLREVRVSVVRIFVSHRWLSCQDKHPDLLPQHVKHKLLCALFERLVSKGWIENHTTNVALWIDYACINQDSANPAEQLNGSMAKIVGACDMMVTPVHDPSWHTWCSQESATSFTDALAEYKAEAFQEYLDRGWCRLEMFYNANVPWDQVKQRLKYFGGKLQQAVIATGTRPHLVFGTRELDLGDEEPVIVRPLRDDEFQRSKYHPASGKVQMEEDRKVIDACVEDLCRINKNLKECAEADMDALLKESLEKGDTPLLIACRSDDVNAANRLLEAGADVMEKNTCGESGLHVASQYGHLDVVRVLCDIGGQKLLMEPTKVRHCIKSYG
jgi:hypothetical protein